MRRKLGENGVRMAEAGKVWEGEGGAAVLAKGGVMALWQKAPSPFPQVVSDLIGCVIGLEDIRGGRKCIHKIYQKFIKI